MTSRLLLGVALSLLAAGALAHDGVLDSYGCHPNIAHGSYHCHVGLLAGRGFATKQKMVEVYKEQQQEERVRARVANPPHADTPLSSGALNAPK